MRVCILGGDGYLGWPTAMYLANRGHDVVLVDNLAKRAWEARCGVRPLKPLPAFAERVQSWNRMAAKTGRKPLRAVVGDIANNYATLVAEFAHIRPDTIIHYAEQPSAPFSMSSQATAVETQRNNVLGTLNVLFAMRETCPDAHLVKLGTLGEYGTPNIDIEEGWLDIEHNGRRDRVLYPKRPGSFYHLSKVHDSANLEFGCRIWNMRVTDLNQAVVYGIETDEIGLSPDFHTSFHYDSVFGTVINRFVVQAVIGMPLTVYGKGNQTRGVINIRDTLRCVELATLNPARPGEFRVFNQVTQQFSMNALADMVVEAAAQKGIRVEAKHIANPRTELEQHYYNVKHSALEHLGLEPHLLTIPVLGRMIDVVQRYRANVLRGSILPHITWQAGVTHDEPMPKRVAV